MLTRAFAWLQEGMRRRVFRTTGLYLVAVWGLSQGAADLLPVFGASQEAVRMVVIGAVALTPLVILLAWRFDIGPSGIVRDPEDVAKAAAMAFETETTIDAIRDMPTLVAGDLDLGSVRVSWPEAEGREAGFRVFHRSFAIGRGGDCEIRILDPLISRVHARVAPEDGVWRIRDQGSTNGTRLDGEAVTDATLPIRCEVRLNAAGPTLTLTRLATGAETFDALNAQGGEAKPVALRVPGRAIAEREPMT